MGNNAPEGLQPKQEEALVALLNHPTVRQAAGSLGVSENTVHRWLDEPAFANAYRRARRQAFNVAVGLTQKYSALAIQTLAKIMSDDTAPHSAKVAAASAMLKFSRESIELDDLAGRLDDVEARLSAKSVENSYGAHG